MPKELAASFKAIDRLDLHALDDVTDKRLQDLAAAQHVPREDNLLAEALRKLHGGSICSRSECPSVTGSLSRADSFDMDDNMSEATLTTVTGLTMQLTPLRRRLDIPHRPAASLHSSKPSVESIGSPFGTTKSASSRLWLPPKRPDSALVKPGGMSADAANPSSSDPNTPPDDPSSSQSPFTPPIQACDSPLLQSFHSATSFSTQSVPSSHRASQHQHRARPGRRAKRLPHPQSQVCHLTYLTQRPRPTAQPACNQRRMCSILHTTVVPRADLLSAQLKHQNITQYLLRCVKWPCN